VFGGFHYAFFKHTHLVYFDLLRASVSFPFSLLPPFDPPQIVPLSHSYPTTTIINTIIITTTIITIILGLGSTSFFSIANQASHIYQINKEGGRKWWKNNFVKGREVG
jgi:hypothetical protein